MDYTWITDQIAVGGGIWNEDNMLEVVQLGITHILNMQVEFDDQPLAEPWEIKVLWVPIDDDFQPKSPEISNTERILPAKPCKILKLACIFTVRPASIARP